jgi:transposase InsO family protein
MLRATLLLGATLLVLLAAAAAMAAAGAATASASASATTPSWTAAAAACAATLLATATPISARWRRSATASACEHRLRLDKCLQFEGHVRGQRAIILKDDGSESDWVSKGFIDKLNLTHKIVPDAGKHMAVTIDNRRTPVVGTIKLLFHIGQFYEYRCFGVLDGSKEDIVLGMPFLTDHNPDVDYALRTMTINKYGTKGRQRTFVFHATVAKINMSPRRGNSNNNPSTSSSSSSNDHGGDIRLLRTRVLRKMSRSKSTRDTLQLYWVQVLPTGRLVQAASADAATKTTTSTSTTLRNEITAATISVVPGDAGGHRLGSPRDHGPDKTERGDAGSPTPFSVRMAALVERYSRLFDKPTGVIDRPGFEHHIKLVEGAAPTKSPAYRMTPRMLAETRRQLSELLDKGHIRPSKSPYAAPILFVGKKDSEELRMCVDYRRLNNITVKDSYPIPRIDQLIDVLSGAEKFTKLDMASAFNQIPVAKEDIEKTAFTTRYGNFEFRVMPFGLCNAPATCMRYMQHVLHDLLDRSVIVYMDDLCIFSSERDHEARVEEVLQRLDAAQLRLKQSKCTFGADSISYLGHIISKDGVRMDPVKIETILEWPTPKNASDVRSFLGLIGYYRKFLGGFGEISAPLVELTKKDAKWAWDASHQRAFSALKEMLTTAPTLLIPNTSPGNSFVIHIDASDYAVGAVLLQDQGRGLQPCAFYSKKLDNAQRNYSVGDKEMLAMKLALMEYKIYVEGLPTVMCTDHRNNVDLLTRPISKVASRRIARVIEFMQQFLPNLTLAYIPGEDNMADAPSRRPDYQEKADNDDDASDASDDANDSSGKAPPPHPLAQFFRKRPFDKLLPIEQSTSVTREHLQDASDPSKLHPAIRCNLLRVELGELEREIVAAYARDPAYRRDRRHTNPFLSTMVGRAPGEQVYRHHGKVAIPNDDNIKKRILQLCHDEQAHIGEAKTLAAITLRFWWPNMATDVKDYVRSCAECQRGKSSTQRPYGLLMPIEAPTEAFKMLTMDFLCVNTRSRSLDAILVVVDKRTKYMIAYATVSTATSQAVAQILEREVFRRFGTPDVIICDNDPRFSSGEFREFCDGLGITLRFTTVYHPQSNGQTERANKTIKDLMATTTKYPSQWKAKLPHVVKAYNDSKNDSTGYPPSLLVHRKYSRQPIDKAVPSARMNHGRPERSLHEINDMVTRNLRQAHANQAKYYNKRRRHITYAEGDKVLVDARYLPKAHHGPRHKFANRREGPFLVVRRLNDNSYSVRVPMNRYGRYKDVHLSVDKLTPYRGSSRWQQDPGLVKHQLRRQVERILRHRRFEGQTRRYFVRYVGHHPGLDEWVPATKIRPREILRKYLRRHDLSE